MDCRANPLSVLVPKWMVERWSEEEIKDLVREAHDLPPDLELIIVRWRTDEL